MINVYKLNENWIGIAFFLHDCILESLFLERGQVHDQILVLSIHACLWASHVHLVHSELYRPLTWHNIVFHKFFCSWLSDELNKKSQQLEQLHVRLVYLVYLVLKSHLYWLFLKFCFFAEHLSSIPNLPDRKWPSAHKIWKGRIELLQSRGVTLAAPVFSFPLFPYSVEKDYIPMISDIPPPRPTLNRNIFTSRGATSLSASGATTMPLLLRYFLFGAPFYTWFPKPL